MTISLTHFREVQNTFNKSKIPHIIMFKNDQNLFCLLDFKFVLDLVFRFSPRIFEISAQNNLQLNFTNSTYMFRDIKI